MTERKTTANSGLNASAAYLVASSFFFAFLFILVDRFSFRSRHLRKAAERYSQFMRTIITTFYSFLFTIILCHGQTHQIEGCFTWENRYYRGDFQKICLNKDSTFFYQRHQNDDLPDYFSKGKWSRTNNSISLMSIESLFSDSQIVNNGGLLQDSLYITVIDTEKGWKLPQFVFDIYDQNMNKISSVKTDSMGRVNVKMITTFRYIKSRMYLDLYPILIDLNNVKHENLLVKMNVRNMRYKNVNNMILSIDKQNILIEKIEINQELQYLLEK